MITSIRIPHKQIVDSELLIPKRFARARRVIQLSYLQI